VHVREVQARVGQDQLAHRGVATQLGAEDRDRLRVRAPVQPELRLAQPVGHLVDEVAHRRVVVAALRRVQLVPEVPGEDRPVRPPALGREGEPPPHVRPRVAAGEELRAVAARAAVAPVVRVPVPAVPVPEGVERREQHAQPRPRAQREQVVPQPDHRRDEPPGRPLEVAVLALRVLEHQPQHGDAAGAQRVQVRLRARQVAAAEEPGELGPGHRLVGADGRPGLARLEDEVGRAGGALDPWKGGHGGRRGRGARGTGARRGDGGGHVGDGGSRRRTHAGGRRGGSDRCRARALAETGAAMALHNKATCHTVLHGTECLAGPTPKGGRRAGRAGHARPPRGVRARAARAHPRGRRAGAVRGLDLPALNRLQKEGKIRGRWVEDADATHPRKYYGLTAEGRACSRRCSPNGPSSQRGWGSSSARRPPSCRPARDRGRSDRGRRRGVLPRAPGRGARRGAAGRPARDPARDPQPRRRAARPVAVARRGRGARRARRPGGVRPPVPRRRRRSAGAAGPPGTSGGHAGVGHPLRPGSAHDAWRPRPALAAALRRPVRGGRGGAPVRDRRRLLSDRHRRVRAAALRGVAARLGGDRRGGRAGCRPARARDHPDRVARGGGDPPRRAWAAGAAGRDARRDLRRAHRRGRRPDPLRRRLGHSARARSPRQGGWRACRSCCSSSRVRDRRLGPAPRDLRGRRPGRARASSSAGSRTTGGRWAS
jgi:hypothetical protein